MVRESGDQLQEILEEMQRLQEKIEENRKNTIIVEAPIGNLFE